MTEYDYRNQQGSINVIADASGNVIRNLAYDPFGDRRASDWSSDIGPTALQQIEASSQTTNRGYTGHEHLDRLGLIHMNGRIYDPRIGRFLQPDPIVQDPSFSQNYNRYAYVFNNPESYTDPTGYSCNGTGCPFKDRNGGGSDGMSKMTIYGQRMKYSFNRGWTTYSYRQYQSLKFVMNGGGSGNPVESPAGGSLMGLGHSSASKAPAKNGTAAGQHGGKMPEVVTIAQRSAVTAQGFVFLVPQIHIPGDIGLTFGREWTGSAIAGKWGRLRGKDDQVFIKKNGIVSKVYNVTGTGKGFSVGVSSQAVVAAGLGPYSGHFQEGTGSIGDLSVTFFWTPGILSSSQGWAGFAFGPTFGVPLPSIVFESTLYTPKK